VGDHEVVIETPRHNAKLSDLQVEEMENILWAYRERIRDMKTDSRFRYAMVFKNYGTAAGASLEHSHSQLIALPIVPKRVFEEMEGARNYYNYRDRCIFCDIIRQEIREEIRIIEENGEIIALAPFASRFPFETWILPKDHRPSFEEMGDYKALAQILLSILNRMDRILDNPPYNFVIHTSHFRESYNEYYHWHLEIMPKLTKVAGFEWGTGFYINPTLPEDAAKSFREVPL